VLAIAVVPGAVGAAPATDAPHVRITPLASLDSMWTANAGAWSPGGTWLAVRRGITQLWVVDAASQRPRPRMLYDAGQWIRSYGWSPDGTWLLLLIGDANPTNLRTLVAVPLAGRGADTLRTGDMLRAFWGSDGLVYFRTPSEWLELSAPARWKPTTSFTARPTKAIEAGPGLAIRLGPAGGPRSELVCFDTFRQDTRMIRVLEAHPDGSRLLVAVSEDTTGITELVDGDGQRLLDFRQAGIRFEPSGLSADGRLIVGFAVDVQGEGWSRSWLEAADVGGHWSTRIAGGDGGQAPQMSREGLFIAFGTSRGTKVARLVVEGPARE
jgi:hypothetical protein